MKLVEVQLQPGDDFNIDGGQFIGVPSTLLRAGATYKEAVDANLNVLPADLIDEPVSLVGTIVGPIFSTFAELAEAVADTRTRLAPLIDGDFEVGVYTLLLLEVGDQQVFKVVSSPVCRPPWHGE